MPKIPTLGRTRAKPTCNEHDAWLVSHTFGGGKRYRVYLVDILSDFGDTLGSQDAGKLSHVLWRG